MDDPQPETAASAEARLRRARDAIFLWSRILVSEFTGTTAEDDPRFHYMRHREDRTLALRAEVSALHTLLLRRLGVGQEEIANATADALEELGRSLAETHPGVIVDPDTGRIAINVKQAGSWMSRYPR